MQQYCSAIDFSDFRACRKLRKRIKAAAINVIGVIGYHNNVGRAKARSVHLTKVTIRCSHSDQEKGLRF